MKKILLSLVVVILASVSILPTFADNFCDITWHGYLVDSDSAKLVNNPGSILDFVENYDRDTALCAKSQAAGYMLYAGRWYRLDKHGNELAIETIKRSLKKKGFLVTVGGKSKNGIVVVERLVEVIDTPATR